MTRLHGPRALDRDRHIDACDSTDCPCYREGLLDIGEQIGWWVPQNDHFAFVGNDIMAMVGGGVPVGGLPVYLINERGQGDHASD